MILISFSLSFFSAGAQDTLTLEPYVGNLKKITVQIQSNHYSFLFDTGGGETFISNEIVNQIHKEKYGKVIGLKMSGETFYSERCDSVILEIGNTVIFHQTIGVWDVMKALPKELPHIDGILSLKSFEDKILTVDLSNNYLIVETDNSFTDKIKGFNKIESVWSTGQSGLELVFFLPIIQKGHPYLFLFDSGNLDLFTISKSTALAWGLENGQATTDKRYNTNINYLDKIINVDIVSKEIIYDGAINYSFIKSGIYMLDLKHKKVWVSL